MSRFDLTVVAGAVSAPLGTKFGFDEDPITGSQFQLMRQWFGSGFGEHFDSDLITLPTGATDIAVATVYVSKLYFVNITGLERQITVKNKAGAPVAFLDAYVLEPRSHLLLDVGGMKFTGGITWFADLAAAVNGQIRGNY